MSNYLREISLAPDKSPIALILCDKNNKIAIILLIFNTILLTSSFN